MITGFCLFTGFSILGFVEDKVKKEQEKYRVRKENKKNKKERESVVISDGEEEEEDNKHIKISSIDELTKVPVKDSTVSQEHLNE